MPGPKEKEKKRQYQKKECPYCHKHFGNLQNHMLMVHPAELEKDGKAPTGLTKEKLLEPKPPAPVDPPAPGAAPYYCQNCKAELRKNEAACWNCGITLIWDGVE